MRMASGGAGMGNDLYNDVEEQATPKGLQILYMVVDYLFIRKTHVFKINSFSFQRLLHRINHEQLILLVIRPQKIKIKKKTLACNP